MSIQSLQYIFAPRRIAVLGADDGPRTAGRAVLSNLVGSGFSGTVYPVHPDREAVFGIAAYPDVREIPMPIDLAVLAGPPETIIPDLDACIEKGVKAALILAGDLHHRVRDRDAQLRTIQERCRRSGIRCIGPNSLGLCRPRLGLNATTARNPIEAGHLAFITQSATLGAAVIDYASAKHVGFSTFVSLGAQIDVNFADLIDFLGMDPETRGIVLYIESVKDGRRFMGAARAFARAKPLVVVKGGEFAASAQVSCTRSGVLAGEDMVYDAVFKRAGMVRVREVLDLFHLSEALAKQGPPAGNRLLIVTNAGGPAIMATDSLLRGGGELAGLSPNTVDALKKLLPEHWRPGNPIDVLSDASPERICRVIETCLNETEAHGILTILTPQFATQPVQTAERLAQLSRNKRRPLLACWMGAGEIATARDILSRADIPTFDAPEQAINSFLYMYNYDRNIKLLYETPANILEDFNPQSSIVERTFRQAAADGRTLLSECESREVLGAYGIPSPPIALAETPEEALALAKTMGFPVALKVESPEVSRRGEVGGTELHVREKDVPWAFERIRNNLLSLRPDAAFRGITVQPMILWPGHALALGAKKDPTFGSVIVFGIGGDLFEAMEDCAVGLPPLNQILARRLMEDTRIYRHLKKKVRPRAGLEVLEQAMLRFSQLIVDFPEIREMDINPFYLGEEQGVCLNARIVLEDAVLSGYKRAAGTCCPENLVVCPYPCHFIDTAFLKDGTPYLIRPIRPEDEPLLHELFKIFSKHTILMRFFQPITEIPHEQMVRYCHIDYDREIALLALIQEGPKETLIGVGRVTMLPDRESAELAVVVGDPWHGQGVGRQLCEHCLDVARGQGVRNMSMDVMWQNRPMRCLAKRLGFEEVRSEDDALIRFRKDLGQTPAASKHKGRKRNR
jgi:acetyltransferase